MMQGVLNVTLQRLALGIPVPAIDLAVMDADVIETDGHNWRFLCNRRQVAAAGTPALKQPECAR